MLPEPSVAVTMPLAEPQKDKSAGNEQYFNPEDVTEQKVGMPPADPHYAS